MLPFANTMFLDLLHEDGLLIAAKGLGIEEVFYSLLRVYSDPGNLVRIAIFIKRLKYL
jgi:DNA excision repair protein ERCC-4